MRIFAKIRQVYDRLRERKEVGADRMRQEREHLSAQAVDSLTNRVDQLSEQADEAPNTRRERQLAVERDSKLSGFDFGRSA